MMTEPTTPAADRVAAYRSPGTRTLYCVICARQEPGWRPITASEVQEQTACDFCGGLVLAVAAQTLGRVIARYMTAADEPVCVCGHPVRLHHEDVCLLAGCSCADCLELGALPDVLARLEGAEAARDRYAAALTRLDQMATAWLAQLPDTIRTATAAEAVHYVVRSALHPLPGSAAARPVRYEVCALPETDINYPLYAIAVEDRGADRWAVTRHRQCLGMDGTWDYELRPSEREEDWLAAHHFDLETALRLAEEATPTVVVNGITAAEAAARAAEWSSGQ